MRRHADRIRSGMWCVPALLAASTIACGGGGGGDGSGSTGNSAPSISSMSFSPDAVYVGSGDGSLSVIGSIDYADPDGDIESLTITVRDASGQVTDTLTSPIEGVVGSKSGTIEGELIVDTTTAGNYTVQVYLTDARNHRSNQLEDGFRIADFPWVAKRGMPTPRRDFATAAIDGRIYVIGGGDVMAGIVPAPVTDVVEVYDPATDSWTSAPPMPTAVTDHVAVTLGGRIYVIGGQEALWPMTDIVQEYDPATQLWTTRTSMPTERRGAAAAVMAGKIYVVGGSSGGFDLATVEAYDPATDSWAALAPLSEPRRDLAAATVNGRLLALGGYGLTRGYEDLVEAYDPQADSWAPLAPMPIPRIDFAVGLTGTELITAGGGNWARALNEVYGYDPSNDAWRARTPLPIPLAWPRAEAVGGKLYVFDTNETYEYTPGNDIY